MSALIELSILYTTADIVLGMGRHYEGEHETKIRHLRAYCLEIG